LLASHHSKVQFCSNSVTGMMTAPAFALVSVCWVISAQCRFFAPGQVKHSRNCREQVQRTHRLGGSAAPGLPLDNARQILWRDHLAPAGRKSSFPCHHNVAVLMRGFRQQDFTGLNPFRGAALARQAILQR
jgi:hypothetical protein